MSVELLERDQRQGEITSGAYVIPADSTEAQVRVTVDIDTLDFLDSKSLTFRMEVWDTATKTFALVTEGTWQGPSTEGDPAPSIANNAIPLRGKRVHVVLDTTDRINMGVNLELV